MAGRKTHNLRVLILRGTTNAATPRPLRKELGFAPGRRSSHRRSLRCSPNRISKSRGQAEPLGCKKGVGQHNAVTQAGRRTSDQSMPADVVCSVEDCSCVMGCCVSVSWSAVEPAMWRHGLRQCKRGAGRHLLDLLRRRLHAPVQLYFTFYITWFLPCPGSHARSVHESRPLAAWYRVRIEPACLWRPWLLRAGIISISASTSEAAWWRAQDSSFCSGCSATFTLKLASIDLPCTCGLARGSRAWSRSNFIYPTSRLSIWYNNCEACVAWIREAHQHKELLELLARLQQGRQDE